MTKEMEPMKATENKDVNWLNSCCVKDLLPAKFCYLFSYAFLGSTVPYLTIYFYGLGLPVSQAGLANGLRTIFPCFLGPLFGMLADKTGRTKLVWQVLTSLMVIIFFIAPWLFASVAEKQKEQLNTCLEHPSIPIVTFTNGTQNTKYQEEQFHYTLFFVALTWGSLVGTFGFTTMAFLDNSVIALVKKHETQSSYALQRIFAPVGFTLSSLISSLAVKLYAKNAYITKYNAIFYCSFPIGILYFISITLLPNGISRVEQERGKNLFRIKITKILQNVEFSCFLITVVILGVGFSVVTGGFLLFFLEEIHTPKTVVGVIVGVASLAEAMIYPYSSKIRTLIGGNYPCSIAAVLSFSLRFLLLSFIKNYWFAIPIQLLHSIGYGLFWVAAIEYTNEVAPKNVVATIFNIVIQLYNCFASVIANIGGGILYQNLGGRLLFQIVAAICGIWGITLVLFYVKWRCFGSKDHNHEKYESIA